MRLSLSEWQVVRYFRPEVIGTTHDQSRDQLSIARFAYFNLAASFLSFCIARGVIRHVSFFRPIFVLPIPDSTMVEYLTSLKII
jgi:hypothetical protein